LDAEVVSEKFGILTAEIQAMTGDNRTPIQVAEGFLSIAIDKMATAIKKISSQRGYDVAPVENRDLEISHLKLLSQFTLKVNGMKRVYSISNS
jgi:hypothetical protein